MILNKENEMLSIAAKNITDKIIEQAENISLFIFNEYGAIGGICSFIALILATHQILMHLYFFNEPKLQLYIVRILLMVPVIYIFIIIYSS